MSRAQRVMPFVGLALGAALLWVPSMVPSVWASGFGLGSPDTDTSALLTQGSPPAATGDAGAGAPGGVPSAPSPMRPSPETMAAEDLTPEMQSVVFRPPTGVLEGELVAIQRRVPATRRGVRATDTAVRATARHLAAGGYENGRLPATALRRSSSGCRMYTPAAIAYDAMAAAAATAGFILEHSGCYRTYQQQVLLRQTRCAQNRCRFAAVPGTSMHGWGLAVDFRIGNRALDYRDDLFAWLTANAGRFGYVHPHWARQGGTLQEPWHWEYGMLTAEAHHTLTGPEADSPGAAIEIGEDKGKLADSLTSPAGSEAGDLEVSEDPDAPDDPGDDDAGEQTP